MSGDGIYSRYLTHYPSAGRYSFDIIVHDNHSKAFTIRTFRSSTNTSASPRRINGSSQISRELLAPCCGSQISVKSEDQIPTGAFLRNAKGPVIHLLSVPPSEIDLMPPASIRDLKIDVLPKSGQLMATWTAPGDDFDLGKVTGYRFIVAENLSNLLDPRSAELQTLVGFQQPDQAGSQTSYQFGIARIDQHYDKDLYIGLVAFDEVDNEASMSNIVNLHLTSDGNYGTNRRYPKLLPRPVTSSSGEMSDSQNVLIGSLCGTLIVMAVILWAGIWYFRNQRGVSSGASKKSGEVGLVIESNNGLDTTNSSPPSTILRESESSVKRQLMQPQMTTVISQNNTQNQEFIQDISTPIYWSASQLLDNNNLALSSSSANRGVNATLDPISEEFIDEENQNQQEDAEIYARGLANYGLQTHQQMRQLVQQSNSSIHEPIYVGYSPETSIYATSSRVIGGSGSSKKKKIAPKVPPKPSINALLGIGIITQQQQQQQNSQTLGPNHRTSNSAAVSNASAADIYGATKRHISHV